MQKERKRDAERERETERETERDRHQATIIFDTQTYVQ